MLKIALAFPGQGSQFIGMGKNLADTFKVAREVFEEVDEVLKQKLSQLMFAGDINELTLTSNAQPALMAVSLAVMKVLESQGLILADQVNCVLGHSLGEYSALTAARSFSISNAANLLKIRGNAMQQAAPAGESGMVAVLGASIEEVEEIVVSAKQNEVCQIANDNAIGQIVISGHLSAMERAIHIAKEKGKKAVKLPVSAAFHSELMLPASKVMEEALSEVEINNPLVPLIANITADLVSSPKVIQKLLVDQVAGRVRFRESVIKLKELGITKVYEIGANKILSGLIKRIEPDMLTVQVGEPQQIDEMLKEIL
ncbi:[acyl-carrier-protein] S-malonyltransferase [Rickettsiales endosymbiont of Stachyamoeba lipophora]|nr:[acyl-carrier-protein] S-malonyltransferase [Rickettsiales endosymbiont of Stachyamoeba lipophora]